MAKKFSVKKMLLSVVALASVAALSIAGTVAYLQDTDSDVNVMTLGNVSIAQHEYERAIGADGNYETIHAEKRNETGYKLTEFKQAKPLYPAVGEVTGWDDTAVCFEQLDGNKLGKMTVLAGLNNVQDKFVFVENTGKSDAYVRTLIAYEVGTKTDAFGDLINTSVNSFWKVNDIGVVAIEENNYYVVEYVYDGNQYPEGGSVIEDANGKHPDGIVHPGEFTYNSLAQVYMASKATNEDVEAIDGNDNGTYDILVLSQAVQAKGFADANTALDAAFGDITEQNHPWAAATQVKVGDDADLEDALKNPDASTIIVELTDDVTYDVAAWAANGMGGEKTDLIVINGNGNTITFNQTNSDWNNIVTNGAKLVINNAKITNSGYNDGPWNRHDLNFACEVELNNVVSDKAIALKAGAALKNVTIDDANTSDTYALWIQPNGQTVTLDDCVIDMIDCTDGRGIKIDEQYVGAPEKVTLKVSDTVFKTEEKSAILVKSVAGADITVDNIDIYGVKADPVNAVWVDEASAAYADLVTVTGGKKAIEGETKVVAAATATEVKSAIKNGADVINANGANIGPLVLASSDVPVGKTVTIANAVVSGKSYDNGVNGTVVFDNCTFTNTGAYSIHFAYGNGNVVFNNCKLDGWCSFGKAVKSVEMNGCTFTGNGTYAMIRFYQDVTLTDCTFDCSNTNTTDVYQDGIDMVEGYTATVINCTNVNGSVADLFEAADIAGTDGKVIIK